MTRKNIGIIYNPASGYKPFHSFTKQYVPMFNSLLSRAGYECIELSAATSDLALFNVKEAIKGKKIQYLVVFGGDGMVHLGFNAVAEAKIPLGIVPVGSGNDFARSVKIPINKIYEVIQGICFGILNASYKTVDCGVVEPLAGNNTLTKTYFAGSLSAGIDAEINLHANSLTLLPSGTRYFVASLKKMISLKPYGYKVHYGSHHFTQEGSICCVSNTPYVGGGVMIAPNAQYDDGLLDVILAPPVNPSEAIRLFLNAYKGLHVKDPRIIEAQVKSVTIQQLPDANELPFLMADGEYVGRAPVKVSVLPKAIDIIFHPSAL
jgi:diacylglycerol kinase (ATP)